MTVHPLRPWRDLASVGAFERLLERRIVLLRGPLDDDAVSEVIGLLLALDGDSDDDIHLYVDSPGGAEASGSGTARGSSTVMFAVHDVMASLRSRVSTRCTGIAASAAGFILATGTGTRSAMPHARIMLNQPHSELDGRAEDVVRQADQIARMHERMERILAGRTGQPLERIRADLARDHWMDASEALAYGVIDEVVSGAA